LKTVVDFLPVPSRGKGARPCELAAAEAVGAGAPDPFARGLCLGSHRRPGWCGLSAVRNEGPGLKQRGTASRAVAHQQGGEQTTRRVQGIGFRKHADLPAGGVSSGKALTGPLVPGQSRPNDAGPSASDQTNRAEQKTRSRNYIPHGLRASRPLLRPPFPSRSQRKGDDSRPRRSDCPPISVGLFGSAR